MAKAADFDGKANETEVVTSESVKGKRKTSILGTKARLWLITINNPQNHGISLEQSGILERFKEDIKTGRVTYVASVMEQSLTVDENDKHTPHGHIAAYFPSQELGGHLHKLFPMAALQDCKANILSVRQYLIKDPTGAWYKKYPEKFGEKLPDDEANFWEWGMTNLNNNELSARTNLHNFCNTVKAGLHSAVVSPRKRHALLVLLLLGAALCAAIYWPYHLPASLAGLMLVPAAFTYLCWSAVSAAAVGYVPGALEMQHNFARIGFTNSAGEAPYLVQKEKCGNAVMQRIVFACDEVAELLDKTGADKARKELLAQIEARLALIARQGRAFGIHLILATQRPDANILPGQIKNNMNIRICGRADTTLSTIIIGDGRAAEQIPHDAQGRFIMEDGTVFQAYYFNDDTISKW